MRREWGGIFDGHIYIVHKILMVFVSLRTITGCGDAIFEFEHGTLQFEFGAAYSGSGASPTPERHGSPPDVETLFLT